MILIADCGSTKIDWCLLKGEKVERFSTPGMNAVMLAPEEMLIRMENELRPALGDKAVEVKKVYFYGAGCISPQVCASVADAIKAIVKNADEVEVNSDLLAAARALCGHHAGIACILGTGSNSCYYDGKAIADNVSPLGYILGDEGSGATLGKILVGDVLKNQLPADLCEKFLAQYQLDRLEIINRVYRQPQANKFLASLTPFLLENIERKEVRELVLNAFKAFFVRNIAWYAKHDAPTRTVNFVGSIAHYYKEVLSEAAIRSGFIVGTVLKSPMDGLIQYHTN